MGDGMNSIFFMSDETNDKIKKWAREFSRRPSKRQIELRKHHRGGTFGGCMACRRFSERQRIQQARQDKLNGGRNLSLFEKIKRLIWRKKEQKLREKEKKMEELEAELKAIDEEENKANAPQPQPQLPPPEYVPIRPPPRPYYESQPAYTTYGPQDLITDHQTPGLNEYFANPQRTDVDFYFMKQEYDPSLNMILPTY